MHDVGKLSSSKFIMYKREAEGESTPGETMEQLINFINLSAAF